MRPARSAPAAESTHEASVFGVPHNHEHREDLGSRRSHRAQTGCQPDADIAWYSIVQPLTSEVAMPILSVPETMVPIGI